MTTSKCSGQALPEVKLTFTKQRCLRVKDVTQLRSPEDVASFITTHFGCEAQEHAIAIHLNIRGEPVSVQVVGIGGLDAAPIDPRIIFAGALTSGAAAIILVHNHPSGVVTPSSHDDLLTERVGEIAKLLGISLLDHIVVGRGGNHYSYALTGRLRT